MTPTKPPTTPTAPTGPTPHLPTAKAPLLQLPLLSFAGVLAQATPKAPNLTPQLGGTPTAPNAAHVLAPVVHAEPEKRSRHSDQELDPSTRQAAQFAPPITSAPIELGRTEVARVNSQVSLEDLVPQLVRKIAWSGDAKRGTVRMELGAGELAGSTLTVSAENGRVSVHVQSPPGTNTDAWRARLAGRLEARGLVVDSVEVA